MAAKSPSEMWSRREFIAGVAALGASRLTAQTTSGADKPEEGREIFIVPNFHPASCGWLTTFSKERIYCANSYLDHLDRVRDDGQYNFVMSEVNNIIAIMNFKPERIPELKQRIEQGRVELVNGFYLESTINLTGGEALVRMGATGLAWYEQSFGVRPKYAWCIDTCGVHDQMAQIASGLGLETLVYTRNNPTGRRFTGPSLRMDLAFLRCAPEATTKRAAFSTAQSLLMMPRWANWKASLLPRRKSLQKAPRC